MGNRVGKIARPGPACPMTGVGATALHLKSSDDR
jgi:hypothetical protein